MCKIKITLVISFLSEHCYKQYMLQEQVEAKSSKFFFVLGPLKERTTEFLLQGIYCLKDKT